MVTWSGPAWLTLDRTDHTPVRSSAGYFLSRSKVYTTSAAVIGVPSLNLTPLRMVNVIDLLPAPPLPGAGQHGRGLAALQRVVVGQRLVHEAHRQQGVRSVERAEVTGPEGAVLIGDRDRAGR